jgi:hypothetical protein
MTRKLICLLGCMLFGVLSLKAEEAPLWLREAAKTDAPIFNKMARYSVLYDESQIEVDESGRIKRTDLYAIKVLLKEGKDRAVANGFYATDTSKIREINAWLIKPNGDVKKFDKDNILDQSVNNSDVYNESRVKLISGSDEAEPGAVFGSETITEEKNYFNQFDWTFQKSNAPVIKSRLTISLPPGWSVKTKWFNRSEIQPSINGNVYTWEMPRLPFIMPEPMAPPLHNVVPYLAVSIFPPADKPTIGKSFSSWSDVSRWYAELSEPQLTLNQDMLKKALELTAGMNSEFEKISAIGRFSQDINYISIQMGIGRFRPHSATEIFSKAYGDCKDKANLMRAMLKAIGINAYPVLIFSGNRYQVREEWPSPLQFNHCIIAVVLKEPVQAPAVIQHDKLGSLLIFDPTDPHTKPGNIPKMEQGSFALIAAGEAGSLLKMPASRPEEDRTERNLNIELSTNGSIRTQIHEAMNGSAAASARATFRELPRDRFNKTIEGWVAGSVTGAQVETIDPQDDRTKGLFTLDVSFIAERYGQLMQGKLLIFNPNVIARRNAVALTEPARRQPIEIESGAFVETVKVKLPDGFTVDETPPAVHLETSFGSYHSECLPVAEGLLYKRSLTLRSTVLPVEQYGQVKNFFISIKNAEQTPVVLIRK